MKTSIVVTLAALAASAVSAVPHRRELFHQHQNAHLDARANPASPGTVTVTQTITEPSAIIWVNKAGVVISTELLGPAAATSTLASVPVVTSQIESAPTAAVPGQFNQGPGQSNQPQVGTPAAQTQSSMAPAASANPANTGSSGNGGYGLCYDMITGTPGGTSCRTAAQVDQDFATFSAAGYKMVRTYDIGCDMGIVAQKAAAHGMKVFIGINSVGNVQGDLTTLINMINGNWGSVDTVNIGNEQASQVGASAVIAALQTGRGLLKAAGFTGNVVTADVFNQWTSAMAAASDYVAANAHGFFDTSCTAANDGTWLQGEYETLTNTIAGGKKVVITESGWPSAGSSNGAAVPGEANQQTAIAAIKAAFADKQDSLYVFQAYDATYKSPGAMGIETSFGIFSGN